MSDSIKVAIKVRPLIKRELDENLPIQWAIQGNSIAPLDPELKKRGEGGFYFDHIFDMSQTSDNLFNTVAKPIVDAAISGVNGTIFAYGQTSSGKTYTMMGSDEDPGVIPLSVDYIFDAIANTYGREFLLRVSYIEIYNERINDLLDKTRIDLKVKEDVKGQVVMDCKEEVINSPAKVLAMMKKGDGNRRTGETNMNERSSRSHTIFRITIESRESNGGSDGAVNVSQLNLVDLAGSERARQTGATGERFNEGRHINMSLSALGLVIMQLSESQDTTKYVNFRDSKLTRILQASLGGNAMTTIICAITPAAMEETQCTLAFASRAKRVKNKPQVNEVLSDAALLKRYAKQMDKLKAELEKAKSADVVEMESKLLEKERANQILEERIELLKKSIVCGSSSPNDDGFNRKAKRRRTWGGPGTFTSKIPPFNRGCGQPMGLPTIKELDRTPEKPKKQDPKKRRQTIIQTLDDFTTQPFQTEFTDFELELIESERARCENRLSDGSSVCDDEYLITKRRPSRNVKFEDDVAVIGGSFRSAETTPERKPRDSSGGHSEPESPTTPKLVLRNRIIFLMEEYNALSKDHRNLEEFTKLERQMYVDEAVEEAMAEHNRILEASEQKCRELTEKYAKLESHSLASDKRLAELEQQLAESSSSMKALQREIQSLTDDANKSKMEKSRSTNVQKETSSIFANETYFEEMEVSDVQCDSMSINETQNLDDLTFNKLDESKKSKELTNAAYSEFIKQIGEKTRDELVTVMQELINAKFSLDDENSKLQIMLQRKIREADDVKNDIRELKSGIEKLHETIHVLTSENTDLTSKLLAEKEHVKEAEQSLQNTIEELNSSINAITEKTLMENSSKECPDQSEISVEKSSTRDEQLQQLIAKYKETIASLTAENEELSSNLMNKIEELDRTKDPKFFTGDHDCAYRELVVNLSDRNKLLEAENIELSNNIIEKIEEYDRAKEQLDSLKLKFSSSTIQPETTKLVEISMNQDNDDDDLYHDNVENSKNLETQTKIIESTKKSVDDLLRLSVGNDAPICPNLVKTHKNDVDVLRQSVLQANRSSHLANEKTIDEIIEKTNQTEISDPTIDQLQQISREDNSQSLNVDDDVQTWKIKTQMLQEQVDNLTTLNEKLTELKITTCKECAHLAELNENRKLLKTEAKQLNRKLRDLQEKFDRESADCELLRSKANENLNLSVCDSTMNGSTIDGLNLNVSYVEERVQCLHRELDDLRDKHEKLADLYKEKCDEIDRLQDSCSRETTPTPTFNDAPRIKRNDVKFTKIQSDMELLRADFRSFKKNIASISVALQKFVNEKQTMMAEIECLRAEKIIDRSDNVDSTENDEKIAVLKNEILRLRKEICDSNGVVEELKNVKITLETEIERLRNANVSAKRDDGTDDSSFDRERVTFLENKAKLLGEDDENSETAEQRLEDVKECSKTDAQTRQQTEKSRYDDETFASEDFTAENMKKVINDLKTDNERLLNEKSVLETEYEALRSEKIILEERMTNNNEATINERIVSLKNEAAHLTEEIKIAKAMKEDLMIVKSSLESEIESLKAEKIIETCPMEEKIEYLENELSLLKTHSASLINREHANVDNSTVESDAEFSQSEKTFVNESSTNRGDVSMTQETMKYLENEVSRLSEEINNSNVVKEGLESTKICLEAEVKILKAEKIAFDEKITQTDGTSAHERIAILEIDVARLNNEIIHSNEVREELESAKSTLEAEVQYLKAEKASDASKIASTDRERIAILETELIGLRDEIEGSKHVETDGTSMKINDRCVDDFSQSQKNVKTSENENSSNNDHDDLSRTIETLKNELKITNEDLKKFVIINDDLNNRLKIIEASENDLKAVKLKLENEISTMRSEMMDCDSPSVNRREKIDELRENNSRLEEVVKIVNERELENAQLKERLSIDSEKSEKQLTEANLKIEKLESEINSLQSSLENVIRKFEDLEKCNSSLTLELEKRKMDNTTNDLETKIDYSSYETLKEYEKMVEELRTKVQDITNDLHANAKETADLNEQLTKLNNAKDELNDARTSLEGQVTCLKRERDDLETNLIGLRDNLRELEERNVSLDLELQSMKTEKRKIDENSDIREYEKNIDFMTIRVEELNRQLEEYSTENQRLIVKVAELEETVRSANVEKDEVIIKNEKIEELNRELKKLATENQELTVKVAELEDTVRSANLERDEIIVKNEKIEELNRELIKLTTENQELTVKVAELEETVRSANVKRDEMIVKNEKIDKMDAELKKLATENQELTVKVAELEETVRSANIEKDEVIVKNERIKELNRELIKLTTENQELKVKVVELEETVRSANIEKDEVIVKNEKIEELNRELKKLTTENQELTVKVAELEETVRSANVEGDKRLMKNVKIEQSNDTTMKIHYDELKSARDCITKEIKSLKPTMDDRELVEKTISQLFALFVHTIMSKEQEIIKALSDRFDAEKRKLEEQIRQAKDAEKRVTLWSKELEADIERTQQDLVAQETKCNERNNEIAKLQNHLKEITHENQLLNEKMNVLELDFNTLQNELEKYPEAKQNVTLNSTQERERLIQEAVDTREMELSAKLRLVEKQSKEKIDELTKMLEHCKTKNIELSNNLEGLEANERQSKSIADMKTNELIKSNATVAKLTSELETITDNYNQLTNKHSTAIRQIDEITTLLKTKCDKLSEYKTKLETITPEYENFKVQSTERQLKLEKYKSEIECMKTENEKQISTLKDRLDSEEIKSSGLRKQLNDLTNRNTTLQTELTTLKIKCDDLERANAKLTKSMRNSLSKIRAEEEMEDLRDENRTLKRNLEGASNRITDLQQMKTQMLEETAELRGKYEALCNENAEMMSALQSRNESLRKNAELRAKHDAMLQQNNRIALELEAKKSIVVQMEKKLNDANAEIERLKITNKELDDEMEDMVTQIHDLRKENAELDDKLYSMTSAATESSGTKIIADETNRLKLQIDDLQTTVENLKLQRDSLSRELEIARESLKCFGSDNAELRGRLGHHDRGDSLSCDSSRSASPAMEIARIDNRRRRSRTELFNQKRHLEIFEPDKPNCCGECRCAVLQDEVCKLERDLVTKNGVIAAMEIRIQSENFPHMKRCKDLEELLASSRRKCKALEIELQKLRELKVTELSSECDKCRHWRTNKCDQSTQCLPKSAPICLSGMSSGIVEDHIKMAKLVKDKETLKQLCRGRHKQIVELEMRVKELEKELNVKTSTNDERMDTIGSSASYTGSKSDFSVNSRQAMKENVPAIGDYQRSATQFRREWFD